MKNKKILIVEKDLFLVNFYKAKFEKVGYSVRYTTGIQDIFKIIRRFKPDLIIFEPLVGGGLEVIENLTFNEESKKIPIFILTTLSSESDRDFFNKLRVKSFMVKTETSFKDVLKKVKEILH